MVGGAEWIRRIELVLRRGLERRVVVEEIRFVRVDVPLRGAVSADGVTYVELGRLSNLDEGSFDLGSLPAARYVRVTDRSAPTGFPGLRDGFDLDAVDVLSGCA